MSLSLSEKAGCQHVPGAADRDTDPCCKEAQIAMKSTPDPEPGLTAEEAAKRKLFNRITIGALILVGILGSLLMFRSVTISQPIPAKPASPAKTASVADKLTPGFPTVQYGNGSHLLQLGVFSDIAKAEALRAKLEKSGVPSTISIGAHVIVGPFQTQEEADAARAKLKELGLDGGASLDTTQ